MVAGSKYSPRLQTYPPGVYSQFQSLSGRLNEVALTTPTIDDVQDIKLDDSTEVEAIEISSNSSCSLPQLRDLFDREPETAELPPQPEPTGKLEFGDMIVCRWSKPALNSIFGDGNESAQSLWDDVVAVEETDNSDDMRKKVYNLDDCLNEFAKEEQLGEDDLWYCPQCKEHRQARKTLELWRCPDILIIHLKRFSAGRSRHKIDSLIEFPIEELNLAGRVGRAKLDPTHSESLRYRLIAVDNHFGGLGGGHYTSFAKNFADGNFYNFDGKDFSRPIEHC